MTFDRDKVTEDAARAEWSVVWPRIPYEVGVGAFSEGTAAALPVIVEAVLAEIEQLHQPMPGSVSALHPIPLCTCLISESPCPTARACAAIREAVADAIESEVAS